jgi:hypothetical protein
MKLFEGIGKRGCDVGKDLLSDPNAAALSTARCHLKMLSDR